MSKALRNLHDRQLLAVHPPNEERWIFQFSDNITLFVSSGWRLHQSGRVVLMSEDHGNFFESDIPLDAAAFILQMLGKSVVSAVTFAPDQTGLNVRFSDQSVLEILIAPEGLKAWELRDPKFGTMIG